MRAFMTMLIVAAVIHGLLLLGAGGTAALLCWLFPSLDVGMALLGGTAVTVSTVYLCGRWINLMHAFVSSQDEDEEACEEDEETEYESDRSMRYFDVAPPSGKHRRRKRR